MNRLFVMLSALLLSAPALARVNSQAFTGTLLNADAPVLVQDTPVELMTREQLQLEYQRLETTRPSLGAPIALTAVGGGLLLAGAGFVYGGLAELIILGSRGTYALVGYIFLGFGSVLAITGGVLLTVGLVKLFQRIGERRAISQRMDDVNARLESLDRASPPPAPVTPPEAGFLRVVPDVVIATF